MFSQLFGFLVIVHAVVLSAADKSSVQSYKHPDKNGYQAQVPGSDKHKYGYELKENKQFHHTTTEKDGVRLGCYGYELNGKKYSTQYVADNRGYRIVSNQDLITVYPKSGGTRKASFVRNFNEPEDVSENIRYFFPDGCKGIDILIDNSSRLRSMASGVSSNSVVFPRLPVTLKTTIADSYVYSTPPNTYIPPGPPHIYAPNQIVVPVTQKPSNVYLPAAEPSNSYLPPDNSYLPPKDPHNSYLPPKDPNNEYLPPKEPTIEYLPPASHVTSRPPTLSPEILPPLSSGCGDFCCDVKSAGKFIIPIPLKGDVKEGCTKQVAKLILPMKGFDEDSIKKLSDAINEEIDGEALVRSILQNLL